MAVYRQVQITFWQDEFVLNLTPEEKFFYLYLMTNSKTTQCGIYELPKRVVEFETGYNAETVDKLLQRFTEYGKILYCNENKEIILLNWIKYNGSNSPKVKRCVERELKAVKTDAFIEKYISLSIQYGYSIDTQPQKEEEQEEEQEEDIKSVLENPPQPIKSKKEILEHWNSKNIIQHRKLSDKLKRTINNALKDYTQSEISKAIDNYAVILGDDKYFWSYKWTLGDFLQRGIDKFLTNACFENYKNDKKPPPGKNAAPQAMNFQQRQYSKEFYDKIKEVNA